MDSKQKNKPNNRCSVPGCRDLYSKRHRFPKKDPILMKSWLNNINNSELQNLPLDIIYKSKFVCDRHFEQSAKVLGTKRGLKADAIPTLHLLKGDSTVKESLEGPLEEFSEPNVIFELPKQVEDVYMHQENSQPIPNTYVPSDQSEQCVSPPKSIKCDQFLNDFQGNIFIPTIPKESDLLVTTDKGLTSLPIAEYQPKNKQSNKCAVPGCTDVTSKRHRFPQKDHELMKTWLNNINSSELQNLPLDIIYKSKYVCDSHFEQSAKVPGTKRGLKADAIPTLHCDPTVKQSPEASLENFTEPNVIFGSPKKVGAVHMFQENSVPSNTKYVQSDESNQSEIPSGKIKSDQFLSDSQDNICIPTSSTENNLLIKTDKRYPFIPLPESQPKHKRNKKCAVPGCRDVTSKRHRFPQKDPELMKAWLNNIDNSQLQDLPFDVIYKSTFVCDRHFDERVKAVGTKRGLKADAIPTLHCRSDYLLYYYENPSKQ